MVRLGTVDSIFTAIYDFASLLDWSAIKKAKVATCLAVYVWVTPLIVVLTSETLSVVAGAKEESALCLSARTLNFTNEAYSNGREPQRINDRVLLSVSWYNTTTMVVAPDFGPDVFDYWAEPSVRYKTLVERAVNLRQAAVRENAAEVCPEGWNCSYVVDFVAPGYKCQELASGVDYKVKKLGGSEAPFNTSVIVPRGNYTYFAITDEGEYGAHQIDSGFAGKPNQKPPYPKNLGAFRTEPIIWIGYATVKDSSAWQPLNQSDKEWDDAYTPVILGCEHYEVNYTVEFNYTRGAQSYDIKHREYLKRAIETTYVPGGKDADKRLIDRTKAVPEENYVRPQDIGKYRRTAAYHSIGNVLREYLNGCISIDRFPDTDLIKTALITQPNYLPVKRLQEGIQKLYEDALISLLSDPSFRTVSWASNGEPSGIARGGPLTSYGCVCQRLTTFFAYNEAQLVTVYAASFAFAFAGVLLGVQAVREEGVVRDMKPSSIIEATRAPSLNELGSTANSGSSALNNSLTKVRAGLNTSADA